MESEKKNFIEITDGFAFGPEFKQPTIEDAINAACNFLPEHTVDEIEKLNSAQFDLNLRLLLTYYEKYTHFQVGEFHQVGFGNISQYYKDRTFTFKELAIKRKNAFVGELALIKNDPRYFFSYKKKICVSCCQNWLPYIIFDKTKFRGDFCCSNSS